MSEVVGYSTDDLKMEPCGSQECALGNLMADAMLIEVCVIQPIFFTFVLSNFVSNFFVKSYEVLVLVKPRSEQS